MGRIKENTLHLCLDYSSSVKLQFLWYKHTRKCPLADRGRKGGRTGETEWMNALRVRESAVL